jgi:phosphoglycerol transferase
VGSVGLLTLLGVALGRVSGALRGRDADLDVPAALTIVALLVAQVGGLGSIFNLLVAPDVRAYNRMSVFIALFALLASAVLLTRLAGRLEASARARRPFLGAGLLALLAFGAADQVPWAALYAIRAGSAPRFAEDEEFVLRLERQLPPGKMVFQLPHASLPVHSPRPPRAPWDPAKPYLSSRSLRWSFGSMLGRTDRWHRSTERLPAMEMVERLALAGFSGIWIDRRAFSKVEAARLEADLTEAVAAPPEVSTRDRYCFISIEALRSRREAELGKDAYAAARAEVLGGGRANR